MNRDTTDAGAGRPGKKENSLERLAQSVDPPSREISDEEIIDPGAGVPREPMERTDQGKPDEGRHH